MLPQILADIVRRVRIVPRRSALPYAAGLAEILGEKGKVTVTPRILAKNRDQTGNAALDVLVNGICTGRLEMDFYEVDGMPRIEEMRYDGKIPGYQHPKTGTSRVFLVANEYPTAGSTIVITQAPLPNNTCACPLYRHDPFASLRFADYERDRGVLKRKV